MRPSLVCLALLSLCLPALFAQGIASPETVRDVDPAVIALVSAWGDHQETLNDRRVQVFDSFDEVRENGQKIQLAHLRTLVISPPNRVRIETEGDSARRTFVYDGQTVTLADHDLGVYGRIDFEGTIEELVDHLYEDYGISTPLADFLSADPDEDLLANVEQAEVIGSGLVGETESIHIACRQDVIDWQAWFTGEEEAPTLSRMVITYKTVPLAPQYTMQLLGLEEIETTPEDFAFETGDLEEIPFQPLTAESEPMQREEI